MRKELLVSVLLVAVMPLCAQWPDYPSSKTPRGADGKAKLDASAPRTADGKPDLSGIWEYRGPMIPGAAQRAGQRGAAPRTPPPPPPLPPDGIPLATFRNIGAGFKDGLPLRPVAAEMLKARKAENGKDNPDAHCLPLGLMQLHTHPQPRKIVQSPDVTVILYEAQAGIRQIFTDGRKLPPADVQPWWYAYSIGHWDGDSLVVETSGFRDDVWLDIDGTPLTNKGKLTERFHRVNYGTLNIDVTVEDPTMYTQPFTVKVIQRIMPDTELIEFICQENDRSGPHLVGK